MLDSLFMWFLANMAYKTEDISQTIYEIMSAYIYEYYSLLRCKRYLVEAEIIKGKLNTSFQLPVLLKLLDASYKIPLTSLGMACAVVSQRLLSDFYRLYCHKVISETFLIS